MSEAAMSSNDKFCKTCGFAVEICALLDPPCCELSERQWLARLVMRCREIIECDTARISTPNGKMFLVIGFNRRSENQWFNEKGEPVNFDYVAETTVANGRTEDELLENLKEYVKISKMTMIEYLEYLTA